MRPIFVVSLILILSLLHPPTTSANFETSLKFFCSRTSYFNLCVRSIKETAPRLRRLNVNTVLAVLMRAADVKAREGKSFALKLAKHSRYNARTRELLRDCADFYDTALGNLAAAGRAIRSGDAGTRDAMMSSAISNLGTCEDGFSEFFIKSPLADRTRVLKYMVDNCLAIAGMRRP
ncbi:pectinesterase inhibitor 12 [Phalaenopsis equestris]|uniref:pectinesterase inhibitor 12 n=1 Tax=Phalaenopsis equestris TaxID=78828 RepID=UPI0009E29207|nr:pectinesterase inhibitor 12 [Phalaenopsis equestris]